MGWIVFLACLFILGLIILIIACRTAMPHPDEVKGQLTSTEQRILDRTERNRLLRGK